MSNRRRRAVAVAVRCAKAGHLIAEIEPFPALGAATHLDVVTMPARFRPSLASYARDVDADGFVTLPEARRRLTLAEFDQPGWSRTSGWACRCGVSSVSESDLSEAAWAWSAERARQHGNTPPPRTITAQRA